MNYTHLSDHELLESCCRRDDLKAYNELVARYAPKLYATCQVYLNDAFLAEEIALDILFWIWKKRQEFSIPDSLSNYLHRAARNAIISQLRKQRRNIVETVSDYAETDAVEYRMADYAVSCQEEEEEYQQLLSGLSARRKEVFVLSREQGFSYKEIAEKTNLSINTIENYMVAALKHFRKGILSLLVLFLNLFFYFF
ncbi:MAG: sigma-70 family RNA polymerase sigma factor [Sphingobacterium sp.]|uniref:sigma-70 family RNA polymerase sigma factor n=1 Tax=unclassified Sphingobacterium TaxID=2609468 RepID=UPI00283F4805|nr:sigma-70 family RNA polymerase sigma factor [Sphingobacterium sp.]MDR3008138.1 sigma-70 family RNA polymerase sigma factor [Sphingobacterium sp.]